MPDQTSPSPRPETITRLQYGAEQSFAMLAGMQLDVFTPLKDGPMTLDQVAGAIGVRPMKLRPLMYALVVAGLLDLEGDLFSNTSEADHFLVKGTPAYMGGMQARLLQHWESMLKSAESIRTGVPQARLDFSEGSEDELETFLRSIQPQTMTSGRELVGKWDFSSCRALADIGGGSGGLAMAVAESCPHVRATVIDLPTVTPITRRIVDEAGLGDRVEVLEADVVKGPVAGAYDVAVLRSLIQVLSPEDAVSALKNVREAVRPGGTIHIIGRMLDNSRLSPVSSVGFSLLTLNLYDEGQSYTEQEYADWLAEAGFAGFERVSLSGGLDMVTAQNPLS